MTKEELAKKRGTVLKDAGQTAAEALLNIMPEPKKESTVEKTPTKEGRAKSDKKKEEKPIKPTEEKEIIAKAEEKKPDIVPEAAPPLNEEEKTSETGHQKVGRPSTGRNSRLSVYISEDLCNMANIASAFRFKGNMSAYITSLIEEDANKNKEIYAQLSALIGRP